MKFGAFKEFRNILNNIDEVINYLRVDLTKTLRELGLGLNRLKFTENFESFKVTVTIPATSELAIQNKLRSRDVPSERIVVRSDSHEVVDGDTEWNQNFVYLKNTGSAAATLTVIFLK